MHPSGPGRKPVGQGSHRAGIRGKIIKVAKKF